MERHDPNRRSIWQPLGICALGIALCVAGFYVGFLFVAIGFISLWLYFHPPRATIPSYEPFPKRAVETTLTRLREV